MSRQNPQILNLMNNNYFKNKLDLESMLPLKESNSGFKGKVDSNTRIWTPDLDLALPVDGRDIPDFEAWVNWSGWKGYADNHTAYDFAAYLTNDGRCVLGLPKNTPVRAIADGVVKQISCGLADSGVPYACFMNIEHASSGSGLFTCYNHINPVVEDGQEVKKGDVIATIYKDEGELEGKLVHLHFEMTNSWGVSDRIVNPESIYPTLNKYRANPQGDPNFQIEGLEKQPPIYIANFQKLLVNNSRII